MAGLYSNFIKRADVQDRRPRILCISTKYLRAYESNDVQANCSGGGGKTGELILMMLTLID